MCDDDYERFKLVYDKSVCDYFMEDKESKYPWHISTVDGLLNSFDDTQKDLTEEVRELEKEKDFWKSCALGYSNSFSIFSREVEVLQETKDINRFVEMYYRYCKERYEELLKGKEDGVIDYERR